MQIYTEHNYFSHNAELCTTSAVSISEYFRVYQSQKLEWNKTIPDKWREVIKT